jgi:hypothetical protein
MLREEVLKGLGWILEVLDYLLREFEREVVIWFLVLILKGL